MVVGDDLARVSRGRPREARPLQISSVHNITSMMALRMSQDADRAISTAVERLSTGHRINRGKDDPSGLIAADNLRARRVTLAKEIEQAERASHVLDVVEGPLGVIGELLIHLDGLIVQSANKGGSGLAEREANQEEANAVLQAIDYIIQTTTFNGKKVLAEGVQLAVAEGSFATPALSVEGLGVIPVQTGEDPLGEPVFEEFSLTDIAGSGAFNLVDGDLENAQKSVKKAIEFVSNTRASIGGYQKYLLGSFLNRAAIELENTTAAESKIRDADFAAEVVSLMRGRIKSETSLRTLGISDGMRSDQVLGLLG